MTGQDTVADDWHKSRASGSGNCVEVRFASDHVELRDTKDRQGAFLQFSHNEWRAFLTGVHNGEFELPRE
jgi:hypothetical protein